MQQSILYKSTNWRIFGDFRVLFENKSCDFLIYLFYILKSHFFVKIGKNFWLEQGWQFQNHNLKIQSTQNLWIWINPLPIGKWSANFEKIVDDVLKF